MSDQPAEDIVVTVALQAVATVRIKASSPREMEAQIKRQLVAPSGEWKLDAFTVREANVQAAAFATAFKVRRPRPTLVERRAVNDSLQIVSEPIAAPQVS